MYIGAAGDFDVSAGGLRRREAYDRFREGAMAKIRKAVFPVAGLGTRFLPATKAMPKELLPIIDKPLVQYAVEEAIEAGIEQLIFVTGRTKRAIEDHFDSNPELESALEAKGDDELRESIRNIVPRGVNCIFLRQPKPNGLGDAVLCARPVVDNEPFAVLLADDLMQDDPPPTAALANAFGNTGDSIIAFSVIGNDDVSDYGILEPSSEGLPGPLVEIRGLVEKPSIENAPSNLASLGRYVFRPEIFDELCNQKPGVNGEIQLADAIDALAKKGCVKGLEFCGTRYDCGSKFGYLEAIVDFAIGHEEFGTRFLDLLRARLNEREGRS